MTLILAVAMERPRARTPWLAASVFTFVGLLRMRLAQPGPSAFSRERMDSVLAMCTAALLVGTVLAQRGLQPDPPVACDSCVAWNGPQLPFKVFGNTFFVGTAGLSSVLITSPGGLVLLDGALPQSAPEIDAHIRALGFRTEDVRLILVSHVHFDHVGGIHALQALSGARVVASASASQALARGNLLPDDPQFGLGLTSTRFPAVDGAASVKDGETVRVGTLAVTAHLTPGHTPGSTTWTWNSCEGARCVNVVYADSLNAVSADGFRFTGDATHGSIEASFRKSISIVERLPCEILITVHPEFSQVFEKLAQRIQHPETNPFVNAGACRAYAASARATLDGRVMAERSGKAR